MRSEGQIWAMETRSNIARPIRFISRDVYLKELVGQADSEVLRNAVIYARCGIPYAAFYIPDAGR